MSVATLNNHITKNAAGVPVIGGTRFKVVHLIMAAQANGWSAEELHVQYPDLSMAEIHSALAYYWDNREEMEEDIERREKFVEEFKRENVANSIRSILKKKGLLLMPVGIYCDLHVLQAVTDGLRRRDVHVITAQEDGSRRFTDRQLLTRATELRMLLYTYDDDLLIEADRRQKVGEPFSGIAHSPSRKSLIGRCIDDLELIAKALDPEELVNRIEYVPY